MHADLIRRALPEGEGAEARLLLLPYFFVQHLAQRPGGTLRGLFRRCTAHVGVRDTGAKVLFCKTLLKTAKGLIAKTLLARLVRLRTAMPASGAWSHERKRAASRLRRPQPSRHPAAASSITRGQQHSNVVSKRQRDHTHGVRELRQDRRVHVAR